MKLVALKRLRYPSGPEGGEYLPGEQFYALSERDAKALKLIRKAADAPVVQQKTASQPDFALTAPVREPAIVEHAIAPVSDDAEVKPKRKYQRRDLTPEE